MTATIDRIEEIVGNTLPEDLLSYYRDNFRKITLPAEIEIPYSTIWIDEVHVLFRPDDVLDFLQADAKSVEFEFRHVPAQTIPIGENGNGDFYVVSVRKSDFGSVYYMFHELADPMDENLTGAPLLSQSFTDWIEAFRKPSDRVPPPDWEAINKAQLQQILNPIKSPWWKFWEK